MPSIRRAISLCLAAYAVLLSIAPLRGQTPSTDGQWSAAFTMPLVAVHTALMRTGQLLMFDAWEIPGTPSARLWDPSTNVYTPVPNGFAELFCAGHFLSADGRLLTSGGHNGAGVGTRDATVFDPSTNTWTALPDLNYARWYPTLIQLADGRALTMGGAISRPSIAVVPEALSVGSPGATWAPFPGAQKDVGEYPMMFQAPNGSVFVAGSDISYGSWLIDSNLQNWTPLGQSPAPGGTAVMYRPGKIMMASGGSVGGDPVVRNTAVIDLNAPSPAWRQTAPLNFARSQHTLVILPDGKVLVVGGANEVSLISTNGVLTPEIWDPVTETWTQVAPMSHRRMYHSTAILLPDGRVLAAGGGRINPAVTDETNGEFYSPPYLFKGARPVVTAAPSSLAYGDTFTVATPTPGAVTRVTFVRVSSVTHGINMDQRFFELPFTTTAGGLTVTAPNDPRTAPAGDYLLFALGAGDVPSLGRFVRLGGAAGAPVLTVSDASMNEGTAANGTMTFTVTLSGSTTQTVSVNYATSDGTALAGSDYTAVSGTLTFPPGTTSRTIGVPIVADAVVEPNETFSVNLSNVVNATIADGVGIGTIVNDDVTALSSLAIDSVTVTEGSGAGQTVASFTVTLTPASAQNVLVSYRTLAGTAVSPADYTSTTGTLTFAGGTTVQTIQVPIQGDLQVEPTETFTVELYNPVQAVLGTAIGTGTILDDDNGTVSATYVLTSGADDVNEDGTSFTADGGTVWLGSGAAAATSYTGLRFTGVAIPAGATVTSAHLEVNALSTQWTSMDFETAAEASGNSAPFTTTSKPSGRTLLTPRVQHSSNAQWVAGTRYALEDITPIVQAAVQQPGWTGQALSLILRGTGSAWARKHVASAESGSATAPRLVVSYTTGGTPTNQPPVIASATATPTSGVAPLAVTFSGAASDPEGAPLTYSWAFGDGQSAAGATVTHTYAAGTFGATLTVSDGVQQTISSSIVVQVSSASLPTLAVSDVSVTEGNSGSPVATFTVTRSSGGTTVSVNYATADGSATSPADYAATSGTLIFTGPTLSMNVSVPIVPDTAVEPDETFTLTLSSPVGATIADATGVATIVNDDGIAGPVTATFVVAAGPDDVNEDGTSFAPDGSTAWLGSGASPTSSYTAYRFTGVTIPVNATITSAHLEVSALTTQWNSMTFEMGAEASGDSAPFTSTSRPSGRTLVVPKVAHASDAQWVAGTRYSLDEIGPVIQAVVQQPAWASGRALSVILKGTGSSWARKHAAAAENGAATAPRLVVTYTAAGGPPANQPPVIASASATPTSGSAPLAVSFTGAATDPEGAALTYTWAFGDASGAAGASTSHTYAAAGTYTATLTVSDGALSTTSAPITITVAAPPTLAIADAAVAEGNTGTTSLSFTVTLSAASTQTVTVAYATADGTATAGSDYTATSGTLTFAPGVTSRSIVVAITGDTISEPNETFNVLLSSPTNATFADASATGTITNDDGISSLAIGDVTVTEGNTGSTAAVFTVTLTPASSQTVTVIYDTANGTAVAGSDFTAASGTLTFAPGVTTQTISVAVLGDTLNEANETFSVGLSGAVNAIIADATGAGTIANDDAVPALSIADVTVTEGNAGTVNAVFVVTLSPASGQTVTASYATANGTATAGSDYTAASGTVSFAPGVTTQQIVVAVSGDTAVEPNETFTVTLSSPANATLADASGLATITNDDLPALAINDVAVVEGNSGTTNATFTVTLSAASAQAVTVAYATANGTATAGSDYTATSGTLTFAAGVTSQPIVVAIAGDTTVEPNETFTVTLSAPVNATIADGSGLGTITNDDSAPGGTPVTVTIPVAAGADDVNEDGATFTGTGALWVGTGQTAAQSYLGLRFAGVGIPAGATITAARIELVSASTQWNSMAFEMAADASANSPAFSATAKPSGRTLLAPRVTHSSDVQWTSGTRYALEDITTLIQAAVSQPGWASGQALSIVLKGTGGAWGRKSVRSQENGATNAPRLVVTYVAP